MRTSSEIVITQIKTQFQYFPTLEDYSKILSELCEKAKQFAGCNISADLCKELNWYSPTDSNF